MYDFIETSHESEVHENYEDLIEEKLFKYKYRQFSDDNETYVAREKRKLARFWQRVKTRDPAIETSLYDLYQQDAMDTSMAKIHLD